MKLTLGLTAALAGCAAAAKQAADVYIFPQADADSSTQSLTPSQARLILLQRLTPAGKGPSSSDIPDGSNVENIVSLLNSYGGPVPSPFSQTQATMPSQLVIMLEGMSDDQIEEMGHALKTKPTFTITDSPSYSANDKLIKNDFYNAGITNEHQCSIKEVTNPFEERCWSGRSTIAKYNVRKVISTTKSGWKGNQDVS